MKSLSACIVLFFFLNASSHALLVVGDSGESIYTNGATAGLGWDYVGHLVEGAPSSVTYVSNGWFVTATHVWDGDVIGKSQDTLQLGDTTYSIDLSSYTSILNSDASESDVSMFRVTSLIDLPAGMVVLESTPEGSDQLRLIGNGLDNSSPQETGLTWGNSATVTRSVHGKDETAIGAESINGNLTSYYLAEYDPTTTGSAYGQTYDSGGGVFVDGALAGVMLGIGTDVTVVADLGTYGAQINAVLAVPEPAVITFIMLSGVGFFVSRRLFFGQ